jgi:uncharacterized membrane protein
LAQREAMEGRSRGVFLGLIVIILSCALVYAIAHIGFRKAVTEKAILQCVVEYGVAQPDPAFGAAGSSAGLQQRGRAADRAS